MNHEDAEMELTADSIITQRVIARPRPHRPVQAGGKVGAVPDAPLFLHLDAVTTILDSLAREEPVEAGGLLVGHSCTDSSGPYLLITQAIPATLARGERLCLTFTHEAWNQMLDRKQKEYSEELIVGWYHTHPGLGVFLSGRDLFIHQHFFTDAMQVALVIDPADFTWGLFYWQNDELVAANGYYIYGRSDQTYQALAELLTEYGVSWGIQTEEVDYNA